MGLVGSVDFVVWILLNSRFANLSFYLLRILLRSSCGQCNEEEVITSCTYGRVLDVAVLRKAVIVDAEGAPRSVG